MDQTYNNFDIKLKEPIHKLEYQKGCITSTTILNDGRIAAGTNDGYLVIYDNKTFKPNLTIKAHSDVITCLIQLKSGLLVSGSLISYSNNNEKIKLFKIYGNTYNVVQTLRGPYSDVHQIIELTNNKLVTSSYHSGEIVFFFKDNNEYKTDFTIDRLSSLGPIIQIKNNEICYYTFPTLYFFDLNERKNITTINNIKACLNNYNDTLLMMTNDLLLVTGFVDIYIININSYTIIRTIDVSESTSGLYCACLINNEMILTGDMEGKIIQWKIDGDNLRLLSKKAKCHDGGVTVIKKIGNGLIMSKSREIKIW